MNNNILLVEINGQLEKCYYLWHKCVDDIINEHNTSKSEIKLLLSEVKSFSRQIKYVVEVVILDENTSICVNDHKISKYIDYFLLENHLDEIIKVKNTKKNFDQNNFKTDILVNEELRVYLKTPVHNHIALNDFDSIKTIIHDIVSKLKAGYKVVILYCNMNGMTVAGPPKGLCNEKKGLIESLRKLSIEFWQVNLHVDHRGVILKDYFAINY
jgi:hypothetical protein